MRYLLLCLLLSASAFAQCPLNRLSGVWSFNVQSVIDRGNRNDFAIAGQFRASVGADRLGNPLGVLSITATALISGSTARQEVDAGTYQLNADCTGGTLTMNLSSYPMQYDFWFHSNGQGMTLASSLQGKPAVGNATLGASGCPAGVNPLALVSGNYGFKIQVIPWDTEFGTAIITTRSFGIAGRMVATRDLDRANNPIGVLAITATSNLLQGAGAASVTRLERGVGRFQVNDDCSGGTLTMNLSTATSSAS